MSNDPFPRFLNFSNTVLNRLCSGHKWFIAFGALLYFIRDKNLGKKFNTDMDVAILGQIPVDDVMKAFSQYKFKLVNKVVDDRTGLPFQMTFEYTNEGKKFALDLFFWVKAHGYWWHTYDYHMEEKKIPREYVFKGTDKRAFEGDIIKMKWAEIAPPVNFPKLYGTLLDIWYPDWLIPRKGQSQWDKMVRVKNCKNLKENLR